MKASKSDAAIKAYTRAHRGAFDSSLSSNIHLLASTYGQKFSPSGPCQYMARSLVANAAGERGKFFTSATSPTICAESQAGGAGGRNSLGDERRNGFHVVAVTLAGL